MICPKCGYEYRPEIEMCPDCDLQLISQTARQSDAVPWRGIMELAVIACLGPWLWYFLAALVSQLRFIPWSFEISGVMVIPGLLAFAAIVYGYRRRIDTSAGALVGGWLVSCLIHFMLAVGFVLAGLIPEPWKLIICLPACAVLSGIVNILVWFGRMLRYVRRMERLERISREELTGSDTSPPADS